MKSFQASTRIDAPASKVWALLTDVARWTAWNSTVTQVEGTVAPGSKVTVHAKVSPGRAFPVRVAELVPNARMVWKAGMPLGLFTGTRTFTLKEAGPDVTVFDMHEEFVGLLAPLIGRSIPDLQPAFDEFAACLKRAAEAG